MPEISIGAVVEVADPAGQSATFTAIGEVSNITPPGFTVDKVETTHEGTTVKEFMPGLVEIPDLSFDVNLMVGGAAHTLLATMAGSREERVWHFDFGGAGKIFEFTAFISNFDMKSPTGDKRSASVTLTKSTGTVTTL